MLWGGKTLIPCQSYILSSALGTGSGPAVGDPVSAHQNPRVPFTGLCALPRPWIHLLLTQAPVTPCRAVPGEKGSSSALRGKLGKWQTLQSFPSTVSTPTPMPRPNGVLPLFLPLSLPRFSWDHFLVRNHLYLDPRLKVCFWGT